MKNLRAVSQQAISWAGLLIAPFAWADESSNPLVAQLPSASTWERLHPTVELSVPQLIRAGLELDLPDHTVFRPFVQGGGLIYPFSNSLPSVSIWGFEGGIRARPWLQSGFGASLSLGFQQASIRTGLSSLKVDGDPIATSGSIQLRNWAIKPSISYTFQLSSGLEASFELGARIPLLSWGRLFFEDSTTGRTTENSSVLYVSSNTAIGRIASLVQPEVTLFRLTWRSEAPAR